MATSPSSSCVICQKKVSRDKLVSGHLIRHGITDLIKRDYPQWTNDCFICTDDLNKYRHQYVQVMLETDKGELNKLEHEVLESIKKQEILSRNINEVMQEKLTFGQRLADDIARFGGSWTFIIVFGVVIISWMIVNIVALRKPFDPYPFILLNLVLSCLAALQAPVIMMSQNRQAQKDRFQAESDYRTNLKAELEIRLLHEKLDHLLTHQWQRLLEIQELQLELMESSKTAPARSNKKSQDSLP